MTRLLAALIALCAIACASKSEKDRGADPATTQRSTNTDSVRQFARVFYDWYTALALADVRGRAIDSALKVRRGVFDTVLVRELAEDAAAQAKVSGELVGLDFDPVLASQDPCPRYDVGHIEVTTTTYNVHVTPACDRVKGPVPDIVAEVAPRAGGFVFVNFKYPSMKTDLRTELARLRGSRSNKSST